MNFLNSPGAKILGAIGVGDEARGNIQRNLGYTDDQERRARQAGYRNMEELMARERFLQQETEGMRQEQMQPMSIWDKIRRFASNPGETLSNAFSWHPSNTIGRAGEGMRAANERNEGY